MRKQFRRDDSFQFSVAKSLRRPDTAAGMSETKERDCGRVTDLVHKDCPRNHRPRRAEDSRVIGDGCVPAVPAAAAVGAAAGTGAGSQDALDEDHSRVSRVSAGRHDF